jgi:hypothetical protein
MVEHGNMLQKIQMPQAKLQKNPGAKKCQLDAMLIFLRIVQSCDDSGD